MTRKLELSRGLVALVDADAPAEVFTGRKWYASEKWRAGGGPDGRFYATRGEGRRRGRESNREYLHRLVAGAKPGEQVDHINGDTLDNRRVNLRICTQQQNSRNNRGHKGRQWKGTYRHWNRVHGYFWVATIGLSKGNVKYLGRYSRPEWAAAAYDAAARKYFGRYARPNAATRRIFWRGYVREDEAERARRLAMLRLRYQEVGGLYPALPPDDAIWLLEQINRLENEVALLRRRAHEDSADAGAAV